MEYKSEFYNGTLRVDAEENKAYFTEQGGKETEIPVDSKKCADIMAGA
jgi:hypothetical protein